MEVVDAAWRDAWEACGDGCDVDAVRIHRVLLSPQAWQLVTALYEPGHPHTAERRSRGTSRVAVALIAADVDAALGAIDPHALSTWYLGASVRARVLTAGSCRRAFDEYLATALAPLLGPQASVPTVITSVYAWVTERKQLASAREVGGLALNDLPTLVFQCKTQLVSALRSEMLEPLLAYFSGVIRITNGRLQVNGDGVQVAAQLRVLGLETLIQGVAMRTATSILHEIAREATQVDSASGARQALRQQALPALHDVLRAELLSALGSLLEAVPDSRAGAEAGAASFGDVWDLSHSFSRDEAGIAAGAASESDALGLRVHYSLAKVLGEIRTQQLFDMVGLYPESKPALEDLRACLEKTDQKRFVVAHFARALHMRLLHPGVDTHAILVYYVNIVYALRVIDTSGVILSQVLPPVQQYLRTRRDTVQVVVSALLGDDPAFALLRTELDSDSDIHFRAPGFRDTADDEQYGRLEYWADPTWSPRPVDAGPEYSQLRSRDVIDLLVSIFDDRDGFITALEQYTAQQLVRVVDYDCSRVVRRRRLADMLTRRNATTAFSSGDSARVACTTATSCSATSAHRSGSTPIFIGACCPRHRLQCRCCTRSFSHGSSGRTLTHALSRYQRAWPTR